MSYLLLHEFGPATVADLSEAEATALQECGAGLDVRLTRQPGMYEIRASQFVGTIVLPNRTVQITPKVPVERLVYLLGFTPELMTLLAPTRAGHVLDIVTAMKTIYAEALKRLLVRGILRDYRVEEDDLVSVRGQVDVVSLALRRFGVFPPLRCRYQDYTVDREPNRRLLAAALGLSRVGSRRDEASRTLSRLADRFEGVAICQYAPGTVTPLRRDRLLTHYDPALSIAEIILQNASLELRSGNTGAVAFVVDMNKVYERFVGRALMEALGLTGSNRWRMQVGGLYLDRAGKVPMRPDVLWSDEHGRPRLVIDTKYKRETRATSVDVQQVVAYCSALGLRDAVLLYADCVEDLHTIKRSGIRVHQWRLSLKGTVAEVAQEVARVAGALRSLFNSSDMFPASL